MSICLLKAKTENTRMKENFVKEIKKKKTLRNLDDSFVEGIIDEYLKNNNKLHSKLLEHSKPLKSKEFKILLKDIRKKLHEVYGIFDLGKKDLSKFKKFNNIDDEFIKLHKELLKKHKSSLERINDYEKIYSRIFKITGKPKSILDLGCGLNPLSFVFMNLDKVDYSAFELSSKDTSFLNEYFKIMKKFGLNGKAFSCNLINVKELPKADVVFMFKLIDTLEDLKKNVSYELIDQIKAKHLIVSFSTKSICGKNKLPERGWFLKLLRVKKLEYECFETDNELFYVIKK